MLGTRHEEYKNFERDLPFVLNADLERDLLKCSSESNWHENLEIQLCTAGSGFVLLDGKRYPFEKGDIVVVNSNVIHLTGTDTELTYSCLIISTEFCNRIGIEHQRCTFSSFIKSPALAGLFSQLQEIYADSAIPYRIAKLNNLVLQILIELAEHHITKEAPPVSNLRYFATVKSTISYIRENYHRKLTLDEISKAVLCDKYALCRTFKQLTGQTVVENINNYRCIKAIDYLNEGYTVAQTASMCGFENLSFFSKTFQRYTGRLPSAFKKM